MPTIIFKPITRENWRDCVKLKVAPNQDHFVAPNIYSLAQAAYETEMVPLGVYEDETMVGFVMYTKAAADDLGRYWIVRVLIGADQQGKGYGRATMTALIERMRDEIPGLKAVTLDFHRENAVAEKLYESLGFQKTGEIEGDEVVATLTFAQ